MPVRRTTRLLGDLDRLETRIDAELAASRLTGRVRRKLKLELLSVLNGTGEFEEIPRRIPHTVALTRRIAARVGPDADYALPRALYEHGTFDASMGAAVAAGRVHRGEWTYVVRLARELGVPPAFGQDELEQPPSWMADVEESHQYLRVWIRELALQDMLLAGMEAFLVPGGSGKPSTEIYGIVFGSYRVAGDLARGPSGLSVMDLNVERVCIQHRAKGYPSEVVADERSEVTHLAMAEQLFPYWHLLGDFHTHTYRNLSEVYERNGWNYSKFDEQVNIEWCARLRQTGHRPRVALIMTLAHAARHVNGSHENWKGLPHVVRATIGSCHVFIAAYRIRPDGRYSTEAIKLKCRHLAGRG
jgi:hypothetical protein